MLAAPPAAVMSKTELKTTAATVAATTPPPITPSSHPAAVPAAGPNGRRQWPEASVEERGQCGEGERVEREPQPVSRRREGRRRDVRKGEVVVDVAARVEHEPGAEQDPGDAAFAPYGARQHRDPAGEEGGGLEPRGDDRPEAAGVGTERVLHHVGGKEHAGERHQQPRLG